MKKITNLLTSFLIALLLLLSNINTSFAEGNCDEKAITRDITKNVETTAAQLRTSLEDYNRTVKTFESYCGEITDKYRGQVLAFDIRTLQQALSVNKSKYAYLTDLSQYEDTNIKWGEVPASTKQCEDLRILAWEKLDHYTSLYTKAIVVFGIAGNEAGLPVSCVCPENSSEPQCTAYTSTKIEEQKTGDKCDTFATYLSSLSSCPLCPIFQAILNTDAKIADIAWRALAKALQSVVMVFFMVFLAIETLKIVSNIAGSSMGSYLKSIFVLGFKVLLTYFLLDNSSYIYGYFISPVLQAGLDMGTSLISISSSQASVCLASNATVDFVSTPGGVLDAGLLDNIMRTVRCYGHTATIMPAVGKGLMCHGWANDGTLLPDFSTWFSGILFFIFGLGIWLVISFYLIDCTVQLGMLCGIVPFLVACWPFKVTQRYSIKGVQLLMNTFFNYVMLGIVLLLGVEIVDFATGQKSGSLDVIMDAMNNNNLTKIREVASLDGVEILILVVCCIFAFQLIGKTNALADKFSKGTGMNIASRLGGLAAGAAVGAATTGVSMGAKIGESALEEMGITGAFGGASQKAKDFILDSASSFGKAVGLEKYQPQNTQGSEQSPENPSPSPDNNENSASGDSNQNNAEDESNNSGNNEEKRNETSREPPR